MDFVFLKVLSQQHLLKKYSTEEKSGGLQWDTRMFIMQYQNQIKFKNVSQKIKGGIIKEFSKSIVEKLFRQFFK